MLVKSLVPPSRRWAGNADCQIGMRNWRLLHELSRTRLHQDRGDPVRHRPSATPAAADPAVQSTAYLLERVPAVRELCGTLYIWAGSRVTRRRGGRARTSRRTASCTARRPSSSPAITRRRTYRDSSRRCSRPTTTTSTRSSSSTTTARRDSGGRGARRRGAADQACSSGASRRRRARAAGRLRGRDRPLRPLARLRLRAHRPRAARPLRRRGGAAATARSAAGSPTTRSSSTTRCPRSWPTAASTCWCGRSCDGPCATSRTT